MQIFRRSKQTKHILHTSAEQQSTFNFSQEDKHYIFTVLFFLSRTQRNADATANKKTRKGYSLDLWRAKAELELLSISSVMYFHGILPLSNIYEHLRHINRPDRLHKTVAT